MSGIFFYFVFINPQRLREVRIFMRGVYSLPLVLEVNNSSVIDCLGFMTVNKTNKSLLV